MVRKLNFIEPTSKVRALFQHNHFALIIIIVVHVVKHKLVPYYPNKRPFQKHLISRRISQDSETNCKLINRVPKGRVIIVKQGKCLWHCTSFFKQFYDYLNSGLVCGNVVKTGNSISSTGVAQGNPICNN